MKEIIQSHIGISEHAYQAFLGIAEKKHAAKKEIISRPERVNNNLLFLDEGIMRAYRYIDGDSYTHYFFGAKWFATDFKSYVSEQPSELYIETLTEVTYYEFKKSDLLNLYTAHHPLEKLGRIIAEKAFLLMVDRVSDLQTVDLKERYTRLMQKNPDLFNQVPQKYIASYLGVSEQSLSRIKSIIL